ncbi:MAG: hypothetical protein ACI93R_002988 [Flavobacteriales bacterium]|jgi:hypothetical protein
MNIPESIIIAGGGTAGWMAANLLQHAWPKTIITLVESAEIGVIGVGEGSTPYLKTFFKNLGISDAEWMPKCNATYKAGIDFSAWSETPGYKKYFHPFFSELDIEPATSFFTNALAQRRGDAVYAHPDFHFVSTQIAKQYRAPIPVRPLGHELDYGYHFDSSLLGVFLKERAISLGLIRIEDTVINVELDADGCISSLLTKINGEVKAEFFVDCTGFRSLLMGENLKVPFKSFKNNLVNNAAVAISTPLADDMPIPSQTSSKALSHGWAWGIPLTNRFGNGYVYSDTHINATDAEAEFRAHLNISGDADITVKHLKMKVGRLEKHWHKNCLAVGLSQGFIEPLEATALMLTQYTIDSFIKCAGENVGSMTAVVAEKNREKFNGKINNVIEGIRDYIVTHYKLNSRSDSEYWREAREEIQISNNLSALLSSWQKSGEEFEETLSVLKNNLIYHRASWYVILSGMGFFPRATLHNRLQHGRLQHQRYTVSDPMGNRRIQQEIYCKEKAAILFPDHREFLLTM